MFHACVPEASAESKAVRGVAHLLTSARCIQGLNFKEQLFEEGSTVLHVAAQRGDVSIVGALLAHKADLSITDGEVS